MGTRLNRRNFCTVAYACVLSGNPRVAWRLHSPTRQVFSIVHQDSRKFASLLLLASEIRRSGHMDRGEVATSAQENAVPPCRSTEFTKGFFHMAVDRKLEFCMSLDTMMHRGRDGCFQPPPAQIRT